MAQDTFYSFADTLDAVKPRHHVPPPKGSVFNVNPDGSLDLHIWAGMPFPFAKCPVYGGCPDSPEKALPPVRSDNEDVATAIDNSRKTIRNPKVSLVKRIEELNIIGRWIGDFSKSENLRETLPEKYKDISVLRDDYKFIINELLNEGMAGRSPFERYNALSGVNRTFNASKVLNVFPENAKLSDLGINMQTFNNALLSAASDLVPQVADILRTPFITKNERDYNFMVLEHAANTLGNMAPHLRNEMEALIREFKPQNKSEISPSGIIVTATSLRTPKLA